jgi:hypothetical protein
MADWFAPKRYGYGAGLPIAWQGWAVSLAYVGVIGLAAWLLPPRPANVLAVVVPATVALIVVTMRTTRGGWRWRWGEKD